MSAVERLFNGNAGANIALAKRGITAAELDVIEFPPISWVVPNYIAEGLTILAGRPKLGKSWLCMDNAIAVSTGGVAFGSIKCEQGDVLYAALEDNRRRLQRRMRRVFPARDKPHRLTFWTDMPKLDGGGIDTIREWANGQENPRLVIIDVFARVRSDKKSNETQYDADYRGIAQLQALASDLGIAIVVVAHVRKMEADDPLDTVSGTLGFTGAADTVLVLSRDAQGVTLYGRGRDIEEIETAVKFEADHCRWVILGDADAVRMSDERASVIRALGAGNTHNSSGMKPSDIAEATGMKPGNLRVLLHKMAKTGEIERREYGRYVVGNSGNTSPD